MNKRLFHAVTSLFCLLAIDACAQAQPNVVVNGRSSAAEMNQTQKLMFEGAKYSMARQFKEADAVYSQIIASDGGNTEAYLQRAVVRRELGDESGKVSDARNAVALASASLQANPRDFNLYYQRSLALRLLKQFDGARRDLNAAMQLGGSVTWQNDLQAIDLEQKMAQ